MKKRNSVLLLSMLFITLTGCSKESGQSTREDTSPTPTISESNTGNTDNADTPAIVPAPGETSQTPEEPVSEMVIQVSDGEYTVSFQLNDSKAARSLYEQLPLSLEVQDYSNNEKIFYPPEPLDTTDTPLAGGEVGTLAYYAPWEDVVLFFGSYSSNRSLYELGQAVSGSEHIHLLNGTITIEVAP